MLIVPYSIEALRTREVVNRLLRVKTTPLHFNKQRHTTLVLQSQFDTLQTFVVKVRFAMRQSSPFFDKPRIRSHQRMNVVHLGDRFSHETRGAVTRRDRSTLMLRLPDGRWHCRPAGNVTRRGRVTRVWPRRLRGLRQSPSGAAPATSGCILRKTRTARRSAWPFSVRDPSVRTGRPHPRLPTPAGR